MNNLEKFIGQQLTETVEKELKRKYNSTYGIRFLRESSLLTSDYVPGRLNVILNENEEIVTIYVE